MMEKITKIQLQLRFEKFSNLVHNMHKFCSRSSRVQEVPYLHNEVGEGGGASFDKIGSGF